MKGKAQGMQLISAESRYSQKLTSPKLIGFVKGLLFFFTHGAWGHPGEGGMTHPKSTCHVRWNQMFMLWDPAQLAVCHDARGMQRIHKLFPSAVPCVWHMVFLKRVLWHPNIINHIALLFQLLQNKKYSKNPLFNCAVKFWVPILFRKLYFIVTNVPLSL